MSEEAWIHDEVMERLQSHWRIIGLVAQMLRFLMIARQLGQVSNFLHTSPQSPKLLAGIVNRHSSLPVAYAEAGEDVMPGRIYVAPRTFT